MNRYTCKISFEQQIEPKEEWMKGVNWSETYNTI